eukprot:495226_1
MSSPSTKPFTKSGLLPVCVIGIMSKPVYHPTNNKCIIISTNYCENKTAGIYKYNMQTNESQTICKYNNTFKPLGHGQFIDTSNNTLILYGG